MYIEADKCRKARVIKEAVQSDGTIKRETVIDKGIAVKLTSLGAYVYDTKEQEGEPVWAEWFPYTSKEGIRVIVYL